MSTGFNWGSRSKKNLEGVHPDMVFLQTKVLENNAPFDAGVSEGVRTLEKQRSYIKAKHSFTLNSRHILAVPDEESYIVSTDKLSDMDTPCGHAVDLVLYKDGNYTSLYAYYIEYAKAVQEMAIEYGIDVVWGGCWQNLRTCGDVDEAIARYHAWCDERGKEPFNDGGHYELSWESYPAKYLHDMSEEELVLVNLTDEQADEYLG